MGRERSLVVVAYDIPDDRRRQRVANTLLGFGARIQGSVYELWLTPREIERMWHKVSLQVGEDDLLRCYTLCAECHERTRSHNMARPEREVAFFG
jgi:CRISPR-associated protein Cas2